jgi:signal transduction protein with GAF and PtsI domain
LSICGEMAADPALVGLLVGLGFRAFSMSPQAIGGVKQGLGRIDTRDAASLARRALRAETPEEIADVMAPLADAIRAAMLS